VPFAFFTARMGELYGEWVGLSSPLWSKSVMIGCNPNRLEVGSGY
jgi:hypothetical protein